LPKEEPKPSSYTKYMPKWCKGDISFCSQWIYEPSNIAACRGCPHLKEEYYSTAIGRFGDKKK
jgi:hypothetical protein